MKKHIGLIVLALVFSSLSAQAGVPRFGHGPVVPNRIISPDGCWPGENTPKSSIIDGTFQISISGESLSGKEVVQAIAAANDAKTALNDGTHFDNVELSAYDDSSTMLASISAEKRAGESREQMIERANAAIKKLQQAPGVSVGCAFRAHANGGVTGSN